MDKIVVNTTRIGQSVYTAGTIIGGGEGDILSALTAAGAALVSASGAALVQAQRANALKLSGGQPQTLDAMMLAVAGGGAGGAIAWSPAGNGTAVTWQDVKALLDAAKAPRQIFLADFGGVYSVDEDAEAYSSFFSAGPGTNATLNFADGVQVRNLGVQVLSQGCFNGGFTVVFNSTGGAPNPLAWDTQDDPTRIAAVGWGGGCVLRNDGTVPVIRVRTNPDGLLIVIAMNTAYVDPGVGPIVELEDGAVVIMAVAQNAIATIDSAWITSVGGGNPATLTVAILTSNSWDFSQMFGWASIAGATFLNQPLNEGGGSGPTSTRPMALLVPALTVGTHYFDTDIVPPRPIYWDGAQFVDALGVGPV